jgi:hypothetical protein
LNLLNLTPFSDIISTRKRDEKPKKACTLVRENGRKVMYINSAGQTTLFDDASNFIGAKLNPENRWLRWQL